MQALARDVFTESSRSHSISPRPSLYAHAVVPVPRFQSFAHSHASTHVESSSSADPDSDFGARSSNHQSRPRYSGRTTGSDARGYLSHELEASPSPVVRMQSQVTPQPHSVNLRDPAGSCQS